MFKSIVLTLGFVAFTTPAFASAPLQSFQYWVRVPANSSSCEEVAAQVGNRFEASTHLSGVEKICRGVVKANFDGVAVNLYSILINYKAENPAELYTASLGGLSDLGAPSPETGSYPTYAECAAALEDQSAKYEHATDLQAVAAYCVPRHGYRNGYTLNVDGFGRPKKRLGIFHPAFSADDSAFLGQVQAYLAANGAEIVRTKDDAFLYYAERSVSFRQQNFGFFHDLSQCETQIEVAATIFRSSGSKSEPLIRCAGESAAGGSVELNGIAAGGYYLSAQTAEPRYFSFDECMQDRSRVLQTGFFYGTRVGAICSDDLGGGNGQFAMQVYLY